MRGICVLESSKVLMYEFHYDYIKNGYGNKSKLLFTDNLMYEIKTEDVYEDFGSDKEKFDSVIIGIISKSKYNDDSNKLAIGKIKDETYVAAIEKFVGLKTKMYSFLIDDNSEHKNGKGVNRNVITTIIYNKY